MKKILYLSNVDWNWIKQRPQFIAEGLLSDFKVLVLYQYRYGRKGFQKRNSKGITAKKIYVIPRFDRYRILNRLNGLIRKAVAACYIIRFRPDVIFVTLPDQINMIPGFYQGQVLYDCMDDHMAMASASWRKNRILKNEMQLCQRAGIILCSSSNLKTTLCSRYGEEFNSKITILRNGFDGEKVKPAVTKCCHDGETDRELKLCYFGTISEWFDFDILLESIKRNEKLQYYLYGPMAGGSIPHNSNIRYMGTIEHSELYQETRGYGGFIMPFKINDIVRSVDPVKLYEYINFGKNILCVQYEEVERFRDFVFFYSDLDSYMRGVQALQKGGLKYTPSQRNEFLDQNSWANRTAVIKKLLTAVDSKEDRRISRRLGIWGCWQDKNLGDQWIKKTMGDIFPQAEFIEMETSLEGYDFLICGGGGLFIDYVPAKWIRVSKKTPFGMIGLGAEFEHTDYRALELYQRARFFFVRDQYSARCMKLKNNPRSYDITFADPLEIAPCGGTGSDRCLFVWRTPEEWMLRDRNFAGYQDAHYDYMEWERAVHDHFAQVREHDFFTYDSDVQKITEGCDFIISGRYHGIIAAVQMGIPCIGIDLCPKIRALMEEIGIGEYCLKLSEAGKLPQKIARAKEDRKNIREKELTYRKKAAATIARQIERVKSEISAPEHPQRTVDPRISIRRNIATVRKEVSLLKEHPFYYMTKRIPVLDRLVPKSMMENGSDPGIQRQLREQILKYSNRSDRITLLCEDDNRTAKMLCELGYVNIECRDFDIKRIEKLKHMDPAVTVQFSATLLNIGSGGKMMVCANILNSIPNEERWDLIEAYLRQFEICIFHGRYNREDRLALGPEPIGSFGCREYDMTGFDTQVRSRKHAAQVRIMDGVYIITISRSN